jgi:tRNA modification GTPase
MSDTIFALSSGIGRSGVAVIRLSGRGVRAAFQELCGKVPAARRASLMAIREPRGRLLDKGLCLFFEKPRSFTGEDMGEFHVHGGRAVTKALIDALGELPGLRPADAGEFTRRAFVNGKLDLIEVEALGDLIAAQTRGQLNLAQRLAGGGLSRRAEAWRGKLLAAMALMEAAIDFSDEGDVSADADAPAGQMARAVLADISSVLADGSRGERLRDGVTVVIAGPPNAGKSTLINALARRDVAIVSSVPGTTRDPIEVHLDLGGVPVTMIDTAGLRDVDDAVEAIGVERARQRVAHADLVLWLSPACEGVSETAPPGEHIITIATKADLAPKATKPDAQIRISALTGAGMARFLDLLGERALELAGCEESILLATARQRAALASCVAELDRFLKAEPSISSELRAEHLRLALHALGRLTGRVDVEDMLGEIFTGFCIGK